jgi:glycosyltransferase involved in cell wall biosynthesis
MLSIVIPAYNEARLIGGTLQAMRASAEATGEPFEIVVVDDASTDGTAVIAEAHGARVVPVACRQIAAVRNAGARAARGEWLVFVDADTVAPAETLGEALQALRGGAAGGGARDVRFDGVLPWYARAAVAGMLGMFRATNMTFGCFMFASRQAFDAAGGFDETLFAAEEVAFSRAMRQQGRFVLVGPAVLTSGRKFRTFSLAELTRMGIAASVRGPWALKSRARLELWYGARRDDPS